MFEYIRVSFWEMFLCFSRRRWYDLCKIAQGLTIAGIDEAKHEEFLTKFIEAEQEIDKLNEDIRYVYY